MVPTPTTGSVIREILEAVERLPVLARGAESTLYVGEYLGILAVYKLRRRKEYMDPRLDAKLRRTRTLRESKVLTDARASGVSVPRVLAVFPSIGLIVMEYIAGTRLKEALEANPREACPLGWEAGRILGELHNTGIAHGDPTTSNYILSRDRGLVLIDFGLADYTSDVEDLAVDLHLFRRASTSTHASIAEKLFECFIGGYREARGEEAESVIRRAEEISLRGRYVEERRTVWKP